MEIPKLRAVTRGTWQRFYNIDTGAHYLRLNGSQWFNLSTSGDYQRVLGDLAKELEDEYQDCLPQLRRLND